MPESTTPTATPPAKAQSKSTAATPEPRRRKRPAFERSVESYLREIRERVERLTGGRR